METGWGGWRQQINEISDGRIKKAKLDSLNPGTRISTYVIGCGSTAVRRPGSQSREPEFESFCCRFKTLAVSFIQRSPLSCMHEYLPTDRGRYLNE